MTREKVDEVYSAADALNNCKGFEEEFEYQIEDFNFDNDYFGVFIRENKVFVSEEGLTNRLIKAIRSAVKAELTALEKEFYAIQKES